MIHVALYTSAHARNMSEEHEEKEFTGMSAARAYAKEYQWKGYWVEIFSDEAELLEEYAPDGE